MKWILLTATLLLMAGCEPRRTLDEPMHTEATNQPPTIETNAPPATVP
jgi:hypothetical protein